MKNLLLSILSILVFTSSYSQEFKSIDLSTTVKEVTVYIQGAQVTRTGKLQLSAGKHQVKLKGLSPYIDDKSIQVKGDGDYTLLSVNHSRNYLDPLENEKQVEGLVNQLEGLEKEILLKEARLDVLAEKQSILERNKKLGGEQNGVTVTQISQALTFYETQLTKIKSDEIETELKLKKLKERKQQLENEIRKTNSLRNPPTGEIIIRLETTKTITANFKVTYLVGNAGWYPKYDIRVDDVSKPLELTYKADIFQNTGTDWNKVKLKLSNGDPNQSGVAPDLNTWYLNYARNTVYGEYGIDKGHDGTISGRVTDQEGEGLPGVNVLVKGSTIGTVTDIDGRYSLTLPSNAQTLVFSFIGMKSIERSISSGRMNVSMQEDVQELSEVVVSGLRGKVAGVKIRGASSFKSRAKPKPQINTTTMIENQTTVEFQLDKPYTIKSNGEKLTANLVKHEINADYEYFAVPKLDKDAFLVAKIIGWDNYNLLEGEANLYFEETYVGSSILDAKTLSDTLEVSLGRDKSIVIGREKVDDFSQKKILGPNKVANREFKILVRNKKSQPIKLSLVDQIPVSAISAIEVTTTKLSKGKLDEESGEVKWLLELDGGEQKELRFGYEVKYPKHEQVYLE